MLFLMNETEFAGFADDSTPYFPCDNVDDVIKILKNDFDYSNGFHISKRKRININAVLLLVTMSMSP